MTLSLRDGRAAPLRPHWEGWDQHIDSKCICSAFKK
jgi:hypothetical protein